MCRVFSFMGDTKHIWEMTQQEALDIPYEVWIQRQQEAIASACYGEEHGTYRNSILVWPKSDAKRARKHNESVLKQMVAAQKAGNFRELVIDAHRKAVTAMSNARAKVGL